MNEDQLNTLRQQDINLRDAIRMDEMERPQMPADLNARLMKRMAEEQAKPQRRRMLWPWIAAACVAAVIAVYLTPPKRVSARGEDAFYRADHCSTACSATCTSSRQAHRCQGGAQEGGNSKRGATGTACYDRTALGSRNETCRAESRAEVCDAD